MSKKRQQISATIYDRKGRKLSYGINSYLKSHPLQQYYAKAAGRPDAIFLHAEIHALVKLKSKRKPYRIVVERYLQNGEPGLAKPCEICTQAIQDMGIKVVEYTQ